MRRIGKGGKLVIRTLGTYPDLSLKEAREQAEDVVRLMRKGLDPMEVEEEREREAARKRADTVGGVLEEFIKRHVSQLRSARATEALLRRELLGQKLATVDGKEVWVSDPAKKDHWRERPITSITRRDVIKRIEGVVDRGARAQARKLLANVRKFFNWAVHRDVYGLEASPVDRARANELFGPPKKRKRVLADDELRIVWQASSVLGYPFGTLFTDG